MTQAQQNGADESAWVSRGVKLVTVAAAIAIAARLYRSWRSRRASVAPSSRDGLVLTDTSRVLFRQWEVALGRDASRVDDAEIARRFWSVYDTALASHSYRCIHEKRFLEVRVALHPLYPALIGCESDAAGGFSLPASVRAKPVSARRLLDVGCCFGTDLRALLLAGFRVENVLGVDINPTFWQLGHRLLFEDSDAPLGLAKRFVQADILEGAEAVCSQQPLLDAFVREGIDCVYAGSVYHLLGLDDTLRLSLSLFALVRSGGCLFGRTVGLQPGASQPTSFGRGPRGPRFLHTPGSLRAQLMSVGFRNVRMEATATEKEFGQAPQPGENQPRPGTLMLAFYAEKP